MKPKYLFIDAQQFEEIDRYLEENDGVFACEKQEEIFDRLGWSLDKNLLQGIKAFKETRKSVESAKAELARIKDFYDGEKRKLDSLKTLLIYAIKSKGVESFGVGVDSAKVVEYGPFLPKSEDLDESVVPDSYFEPVPATRKLDKKLLLNGVKLGLVDGIDLVMTIGLKVV